MENYFIIRTYFSLFLISLSFNSSYSQKRQLSFSHITPQNSGLESQYHVFLNNDTHGFVWISSVEGVYRFDGLSIKKFPPQNYPEILGINIQSNFFEDSRGDIWFSTMKGVNRYQYFDDSFQTLRLKKNDNGYIENDYALFCIERDSVLWLEAEGVIYSLNIFTNEQKAIIQTDGARFSVEKFPSGKLKSIIACPWINGPGIEYITFDELRKPIKSFFLNENIIDEDSSPVVVSKAIPQNPNLIWLTSNKGLIELNPNNPLNAKLYKSPYSENQGFIDGFMEGNKYLWMTQQGAGLNVFDIKNRTFVQQINNHEDNKNGISSNFNLGVYLDNQELVWVTNLDHSAIDIAWLKNNHFFNPFERIHKKKPLILSITEDNEGNIFCTSFNEKIYIFDKDGRFMNELEFPVNSKKSTIPIHQISIDGNGRKWAVGSKSLFLLEKKHWEKVYSSGQGNILSLIHISEKSKIIATNRGIFELKGDAKFPLSLFLNKELTHQEKSIKVSQLFQTPSKKVYGASEGKDLFKFTFSNEAEPIIDHWEIQANTFDILEELNSQEIIIATSDGIQSLNLRNGKLERPLDEFLDLRNKSINTVFKSSQNNLMFSTGTELYLTSEENEVIYCFNQDDGLNPNQFVHFSSLKASDGKIWLGAHDGVVVFHPDSIHPYPYGPKIFLKSLIVNNEILPLDTTINEKSLLSLTYYQNTLEFETVAVGSYLPHKSQIAYQLVNYNKEWKRVENGSTLEFNQVPPGNYTLEVYGINANGVKGEPKRLAITIVPPFWQTVWFYLICLGIAGALVHFLVRYYVDQNLRKQREAFEQQKKIDRALEDERDRIAAEMHDDLGSGLNSIRFMIGQIEKPILDEKVSEQLERIESHASNSIEHMQGIIWAMNGNYDQLSELISYTRRYVLEYFEDYEIDCKANLLEDLPDISISGEKRRNIFLCVKEGAHNIVKHAQASEVHLRFSLGQAFIIELQDNGPGFDTENVRKGGNGLRNMGRRMEKIGGKMEISADKGTLLRFSVPLANLQQSTMNIP